MDENATSAIVKYLPIEFSFHFRSNKIEFKSTEHYFIRHNWIDYSISASGNTWLWFLHYFWSKAKLSSLLHILFHNFMLFKNIHMTCQIFQWTLKSSTGTKPIIPAQQIAIVEFSYTFAMHVHICNPRNPFSKKMSTNLFICMYV